MANFDAGWKEALAGHQRVMAQLEGQAEAIGIIAGLLMETFRAGRRIYIFGNGGSAADAQHIAAELVGRFKLNRRALPAVALSTDTSILTAVGNDLGYDVVFARQLEALLAPGDVAWALSTSGNSANILKAAELVRQRGNSLIGFTGATGGKLAALCTHLFRVPHESSDRIQEGHVLAYHFLCECVEKEITNCK